MPRTIEITATFTRERHRFANPNGDVIIGEAHFVQGEKPESVNGGPIAIKGPANMDDLQWQHTYRFFGYWTEYRNKRTGETEQQFAFQTFVAAAPHGRAGVITYLQKAGKGNGIGRARASKLWDKFGADAVRICRESPDVAAAAVSGLTLDDAHSVSQWLINQQHIEGVSIDLIALLEGRGFPKTTFKKCLDLWGNAAVDFIRRDPYRLMQFRGCGFKRCDAMFLELGGLAGRLKRQALCAAYKIKQSTEQFGHTWHAAEVAIKGIKENVAGCDLQIEKALRLAKRAGVLATTRTDGLAGPVVGQGGRLWLADARCAVHESHVARCIADATQETACWPVAGDILGISDHQRSELARALAGPVALFGGSPGTGKTYSAAALILLLIRLHGVGSIAVAAPTGKAAVRISEAMDGYGIPIRAKTIHSLLGVDNSSADGWTFLHNHKAPLPFKYVIVDESSMIDAALMSSLLDARAKGTHILFIGDVNQLPPVGHGAPLRDLIAVGLPYGELREIQRSSGSIVQVCAAIRDNEPWETDERSDVASGLNLILSTPPDDAGYPAAMFARLDAAAGAYGFDPVWECQVLVAVNKKSPLSRRELNKALQERLNHNPGIPNCPFRVGDKIVNTKNGRYKIIDGDTSDADESGETWVANGELAAVVEVEEKSIIARLSAPDRVIRIPRGKASENAEGDSDDGTEDDGLATNTGCAWDLGYALSVHRAQGSEWPIVIVMLDEYPGAKLICDRAWLYTSISRAKKLCVLIGKKATADRMCRHTKIHERKTLLKERINRELTCLLVQEL